MALGEVGYGLIVGLAPENGKILGTEKKMRNAIYG